MESEGTGRLSNLSKRGSGRVKIQIQEPMCLTSRQHGLVLAGLTQLHSKSMRSSVEANHTGVNIIFTQKELMPKCGV